MQTIMIVEDDPDIRDGVRIALDCNRVWVDEQEADLTETEYKILKLLMQSPQRIFPVQVIYETVWGEPYFYVSNGTVMVHIRNLRQQQLDKEHRSEAAALCSKARPFAPCRASGVPLRLPRPERANSAGTATGRVGNPGPLWSHPGRALPASGGTPPRQGGSIPQRSRWTKPAAG